MTFQEHIAHYLPMLTTAQKSLAAYVLENSEQVPFLTAKELGHCVGQSDAAVVRFSKAVGYEGFSELRDALREGLLEQMGASGMRQQYTALTGDDLKKTVFNTDMDLLQKVWQLNTDKTVVQAADALIGARRIWVTAHGGTLPIAYYLALHLTQCLDNTQVLTVGAVDMIEQLRRVGPGDVFVGIGYARYLPQTVNILRVAKKRGATVIAMTDSVSSPLAAIADHTLYTVRAVSSRVWWSQTGTMTVINWLTAMVMEKAEPRVLEYLKASDQVLEDLGYWKRPNIGDNDSFSLEERFNAVTKKKKGA